MQEHVIEISKNGAVTITVNGVKGPSCKEATAALEKKLGKVSEDSLKGEYYEQPEVQHSHLA